MIRVKKNEGIILKICEVRFIALNVARKTH
ncbi:hypothetical protein SAMN04489724_0544 [Algoriphagus locisalis]|uniref:Uncharacterized protein n=1 Tax=Algoriphagus locisalis TaxID=305507 RepID=A0A1I6XLI6_9BACT|nr:hypothetical protein SAMN04489724_0544 [Algoriphagus locisalis]